MEQGARILGVDDSLTIRKALELVLKPAGYQLELATSGAEAIEKAKDFRPALLLLDFILPDMRGTEVCKHLAADPETASIPVVLISAKGAEIRQAYQDVGNVVSYITKPFTPEDVTGVVADVLSRSAELLKAPAAPSPIEPAPTPPAEPIITPPISIPTAPPLAGPAEAPRPSEPARAPEWEEAEEAGEEEVVPEIAAKPMVDAARRQAMEEILEALRAGLEGVYVEEVDTTTGAAADEAKTYTDLVSQLTRQLGETLIQARSGARFTLSSDGSVRSLHEMLYDAFRRVCRLLFRAVGTGAVSEERQGGAIRVLVCCSRGSEAMDALQVIAQPSDEWHGLLIAQRFRQLPIMVRLYGPTHLVIEARRGAIWDQIKSVRAMPESRRLRIIAVRPTESAVDNDELLQMGIETVLDDGPDLLARLRDHIAMRAGVSTEAAARIAV